MGISPVQSLLYILTCIPVISGGYLPTGGTAKNSEINIINGSPPPSDHLLGKVMINIFPPLERNHPSNLGSSLHKSALQILHSHHGVAIGDQCKVVFARLFWISHPIP
jgi:hypothetical protein